MTKFDFYLTSQDIKSKKNQKDTECSKRIRKIL